MSASSSPTLAPVRWSATAIFTLIVDFPTPPFPEATPRMLRTPSTGRRPSIGSFAACTSAETRTSTEETPETARTASSTAACISAFFGQAGVVSTRSRDTAPFNTAMLRTMFRVTRSFPSSGSRTWDSASRTRSTARSDCADFRPNQPIPLLLDAECIHSTTEHRPGNRCAPGNSSCGCRIGWGSEAKRRDGGPVSRGPFPKRTSTERVDAPPPARRPSEAYPLRYDEGGQRSRGGCSGPRMPGSEGMVPWMPEACEARN